MNLIRQRGLPLGVHDRCARSQKEKFVPQRPVISRSQLLAGVASAAALWPHIARAQTLETIRLAGVATDDLTPVYYAINKGLYKKAGIDVQVVPTSSGGAATQAVIGGAYELGKGSLIASLSAHLKNLPLTIVGNGGWWDPKSPFNMMVVASDSPAKRGSDLNGKTLSATALNDLNSLVMKVWIDKNGGDAKSVKFIEVPNSAAAAALVDHRIDGTCLNEPQLSAAVDSRKVRILAPAYSAIAEHFVFTVYFAQPSWATAHKDAIAKFQRVTYDAAKYTNTHHSETVALMSGVTKIPESTIAKMARTPHATSGDPALIQVAIDAAAKYGFIDKSFTAKEAYFSG
jgi:NitT/TauT family transport system substrate-binding protein